jgi:acyl-CoA reductase-like NAD-dependent aldehyde dehydrogenase
LSWGRTDPAARGERLQAAAHALRDAAGDLVGLLHRETHRLPDEARASVLAGAATLDQYAQLGPLHTATSSHGRTLLGGWEAIDLMRPEPRGVVAAITPWNDPVAVACGLLGAALVTGNTVVHKPSERCPGTGRVLTELLAGLLPEGVLQVLDGDGATGAALAAHPGIDLVAHVGSVRAGRSIAAATARTGAALLRENGGNDPLVVDADVDPAWAAEQAAVGAFTNAGQVCVSVERIYVPERIAAAFLGELAGQARRRVPLDRNNGTGGDSVPMAALVDAEHLAAVHRHVTDAVECGARLLTGGRRPGGDPSFYPATVLTGCHRRMLVMREETFGPVAPVQVVRDFDEGLAEAAHDEHGLTATVLTRSMAHAQRACRELPVGHVKVNAVFGGAPGGASQPRRASGSGFGFGPELLDEMTTTKVLHLAPAP